MSSSLYKITIPSGSTIKKEEILDFLKEVVYKRCVDTKGVPKGYKIDFRDGDRCNLIPSNLYLIRC